MQVITYNVNINVYLKSGSNVSLKVSPDNEFCLIRSISECYPGMVVMLALSSFSVSHAEVSREAVL